MPGRRLRILLQVTAIVGLVVVAKLILHRLGWEGISINQLFSALVASNVFLLGFLLNGVLSDYKESEKIPGEIASALTLLAREVKAIPVHHPEAFVQRDLDAIVLLGQSILAWLVGRESTQSMLKSYDYAHDRVVIASRWLAHSSLKGRLMMELAAILRSVNRVDVIRETDFVKMVYWLAYAATSLLLAGLVFAKSEAIVESCFFLFVIGWLLIFLLHLISDLDNPFGYSDPESAENIALDVLIASQARIERLALEHQDQASAG